jgi:small nuclear ribonucleoprotein (snRNP)-like protein
MKFQPLLASYRSDAAKKKTLARVRVETSSGREFAGVLVDVEEDYFVVLIDQQEIPDNVPILAVNRLRHIGLVNPDAKSAGEETETDSEPVRKAG